MKIISIKTVCIVASVTLMSSCWDGIGDHSVTEAKYTGLNTAQVIYKSTNRDVRLVDGAVHIFNANYEKEYTIDYEGSHNYVGNFRYAVDIKVTPDWQPGDLVTVSGWGYFGGTAYFNVPEQ